MELFVLTFAGTVLAFAAMGVGVLAGRSPLRRGCGELSEEPCDACTRPCPRRRAAAGDPR